MANDPGEWYEEQRALAERLDFAVKHLQAYLRRLDKQLLQAQRAILHEYLRALVHDLEQARDVGD